MSDPDIVIATFIAYLAVLAILGVLAYRQTRDIAYFVLGGRRLGRCITALSAGASDMSGWLLLGLPGYAYLAGLESLWIALGLGLGTWGNWHLVALRLRVFSQLADDALTIPEFLANRFGSDRPLLPVLSAVVILLFFLVYTAAGLVAAGKLFETVFGMPYLLAVALGLAAIVLYTAAGGFLAVSWTDAVQAGLMFFALLLVPVVALGQTGGVAGAWQLLDAVAPQLLNPFTDAQGETLGLLAVISLLAWGLGYFGQPHILARFKAIRSPGEIAGARRIALAWVSVSLLAAVAVGVLGRIVIGGGLSASDAEKVFLLLVDALLPATLAGVCLAAVLAAIMSTADSQLLVCSAAFTEDIYRRLRRRSRAAGSLVAVGRGVVVLMALGAFALAADRDSQVLDLVAYAWAGFGAAFGPTLLLALYWRRFNEAGAAAAILSGGLTVVAWHNLEGGIFELYEIVPGFVVAGVAGVVVSRLTAAPGAAVTALFDAAQAALREH